MPFSSLTTGYSAVIVGRTPRSAADALVGLPTAGYGWCDWAKSGSRGTRADQGGRPTSYAGFSVLRKLNDIGLKGALKGRTWYRAPSEDRAVRRSERKSQGAFCGSHMPVRISDADNSEISVATPEEPKGNRGDNVERCWRSTQRGVAQERGCELLPGAYPPGFVAFVVE